MAPPLLRLPVMPDVRPDDDEHISKKVVYEHTTSARQNMGAIIAIVVIAIALLVFIIMHLK
jgi:hypothetical protein